MRRPVPSAKPLRAPARVRDRAALGYELPKTYEDLRAVLASGSVRLPKRLRQVAVFLWQHPGEVALGNVSTVAEQAGVQPSTLVRFAQNLGYSGFSDLQAVFKEYVKESWPETREARRARAPDAGRKAAFEPAMVHLVGGLARASIQSLSRAVESADEATLARVVATLAAAETIYLIGSKRAFPATTYMSLALAQLGIRNVLVDNVGSSAFAQIGCADARDAVLAVSFSPYNSITPELAALAAQRGVPVLAITDSALSPLVNLSRAWIEVVESDFGGFRSIAATLSVGMAIVLGVAKSREAG